MTQTVAIISEYNPFHCGHEYHIKKIRESFGENTEIIAIMSGNYTQRGDLAITDKFIRAEAAVKCGVDLVLEIPFPFSVSSAELYARSGVCIASAIGVVDYLSFGSESGELGVLEKVAEAMLSEEYLAKQKELISNDNNKELGYAKMCEIAYNECFGHSINKGIFTPNNILAIEYIKELKRQKSTIKPHTVKREGAAYTAESITSSQFQSAAAIRKSIYQNDISALDFVPNLAKETFLQAYNSKKLPCECDKLSAAVISSFLLNNPCDEDNIHDTKGGLYNRLRNSCYEVTSISELINLTATKKYTTSRIKRAIWYSFFGVTSSEVKESPEYTQVLAANSVGREILRRIKKSSDFSVITKPSSTRGLAEKAKTQKDMADIADSIFGLTLPGATPPSDALRSKPYVK